MELISKQEAKDQGLKRYFTGLACKRGHVSDRFVSTRQCCACDIARNQRPERKAQNAANNAIWSASNRERKAATTAIWSASNRERKAATNAIWAKRNPERAAANKAAYRAANPERIAATNAIWEATNRERRAANNAAWRAANPEKVAATAAAWAAANKERTAATAAAWAAANPAARTAMSAQRRAAKLQRTPAWADRAAIKKIYDDCAFISRVTGEPHQVDHIYPLQGKTISGLHCHANLQIITAKENVKKSNKLLDNPFLQ